MADKYQIITVSPNLAIDRVIEVASLKVGEHLIGRELSRTPGGKGFNVSRVCADLGVRTIATGFLAGDNRSLFDDMMGGLIDDRFVEIPGATRENITLVDPVLGSDTHIRNASQRISAKQVSLLANTLADLTTPDSIIIFGGSLPNGIAPADHTELIRSCILAGAKVAVDTNGSALNDIASEQLWLIKPNTIELSELTGLSFSNIAQQIDAAKNLTKNFTNVLLSVGEDGAYLLTASDTYHAAVRVDTKLVRNTVGCGDALLGAFISEIINDQSPANALASAVATASACACSNISAKFDPGVRNELLKLVEVKRL